MRTESEFNKILLMTPTYNQRRHILLWNIMRVEEQTIKSGVIHPGIVIKSIIDLISAQIIVTLDQYQRALDEIESRIQLVSTPIERKKAGLDGFETRHPLDRNFKPKYTALIGSNSEANVIFQESGITHEENLNRLNKAGLLLPKYNS